MYLVNTEHCKIPNLDPYDKTIRHLITKTGVLKCNDIPPMTYIDGHWLRLNKSAIRMYHGDDLDNCTYQEIIRSEAETENSFAYNPPIYFTDDVKMIHEFIRVACYAKQGGMFYVNFHAFILVKPQVEERCKKAKEKFPRLKQSRGWMNVLAIGVESVSRLNFIRQMALTKEFLTKNLGAFEMKGFNKVADNTFVNIVPMLTGMY